jgi:hypothetical protein
MPGYLHIVTDGRNCTPEDRFPGTARSNSRPIDQQIAKLPVYKILTAAGGEMK